MKSSAMKYLFVLTILVPLLGGCLDDDDDDRNKSSPPVSDGSDSGGDDSGGDGGTDEPDPNSISAIFSQSADSEPIEIDDSAALSADIEASFGAPTDDPPEPGEVFDVNGDA